MSGSGDRSPTAERAPMRRRIVGGYALLAILAIAGLVGLGELLRVEHPAAGPATPEVAGGPDGLRDEVECPVPAGREGAERPTITSGPDAAQEVTSNELYDCPEAWDGRAVRYVGEVVGAVLDRGDHAWVQLNDDVYADAIGPLPTHRDFRGGNAGVGARVDAVDAARITTVGGPGTRGDLVEVEATFRRVDQVSGEVAILEVTSLEVLRLGAAFQQPQAPARPIVAGIAAIAALAVLGVSRRRQEG